MTGDITVKCVDCRKDFVITKNEAEFITKQLDERGVPYTLPKRCKPCRVAKKKRFEERDKKLKLRDLNDVLDKINRGEKVTLQ
jgi:hypothetical protein